MARPPWPWIGPINREDTKDKKEKKKKKEKEKEKKVL